MKLSVITDEISMDLARALDVMREYGLEAAELRGVWGKNVADITDEEAHSVKQILDDKGFTVTCLATPVLKCELREGTAGEVGRMHDAAKRGRGQQMDLLNRCMELADFFGTDILRIFSFWKRGELSPEVEADVTQALGETAEVARRAGKIIALENEHDCYISTGVEAGRVISGVNNPALKAVWDPGNAFYAGEEPYPGGYEALKDHIVHVHIKDAERLLGGGQRFVVVGEGQIDYKGHLAALARDGYQGYISLETHYIPFAGTQEQGSRLCLAALKSLTSGITSAASEV